MSSRWCGVTSARHPDALRLRRAQHVDRAGRGHVADVQRRPGLAGQRAVAGDDRLLGGGGPAGQPEPRGDDALVRLGADGEPVVLGVLGDHDVERGGVLQRPAHDHRVGDAAAVVGEHAHLGAAVRHGAELGHLGALEAHGDRADRVHVDEADLVAAAAHVLADDVAVGDRIGVGHGEDGGEAAQRCGGRAGRDGLGLLAAGLAQVRVQVDEAGQQDLARRRRAPRRRRRRDRCRGR